MHQPATQESIRPPDAAKTSLRNWYLNSFGSLFCCDGVFQPKTFCFQSISCAAFNQLYTAASRHWRSCARLQTAVRSDKFSLPLLMLQWKRMVTDALHLNVWKTKRLKTSFRIIIDLSVKFHVVVSQNLVWSFEKLMFTCSERYSLMYARRNFWPQSLRMVQQKQS